MSDLVIEEFNPSEVNEVHDLIRKTFDEFVGKGYSPQGQNTFYDYIEPDKIVNRFQSGNLILVGKMDHKIVGMVEVRDNNHISLFFVDKDYQGKRIGKKLFQSVAERVKGETTYLEVNASPYSEKIYSALGFKKVGELKEEDGIKFVPMKMEL